MRSSSAGQFDGQGDHHTPPAYVEQAFRKYLECGIFAHGFARVRCPASGIDDEAVAQVQAEVRTRILRAFAGCGLIERFEAREMLAYRHSGFSVEAGVGIQAQDRAGLERLLRYCARPPFALERLRQRGAELVYHCPKPQSGGKRGDLVPISYPGRWS